MRLIDVNVLAYLVIDDPHTHRARELLDFDADWHSESFALVELTNVLATQVRTRRMPLRSAIAALRTAQSVVTGCLHTVDHQAALSSAAALEISAYDARYLVLAAELGCLLVTEDAKLRRAAPHLTQSIQEALAA
jgi:predicted nucleic acid-binding protein